MSISFQVYLKWTNCTSSEEPPAQLPPTMLHFYGLFSRYLNFPRSEAQKWEAREPTSTFEQQSFCSVLWDFREQVMVNTAQVGILCAWIDQCQPWVPALPQPLHTCLVTSHSSHTPLSSRQQDLSHITLPTSGHDLLLRHQAHDQPMAHLDRALSAEPQWLPAVQCLKGNYATPQLEIFDLNCSVEQRTNCIQLNWFLLLSIAW